MVIGVPKEIKDNENRVPMTPAGVNTFCLAGHEVLIQKSAGIGSGFEGNEYIEAGASIIETAEGVFEKADMIMKVKEPLSVEYDLLRPN